MEINNITRAFKLVTTDACPGVVVPPIGAVVVVPPIGAVVVVPTAAVVVVVELNCSKILRSP